MEVDREVAIGTSLTWVCVVTQVSRFQLLVPVAWGWRLGSDSMNALSNI